MTIFCNVALRSFVKTDGRFGGTYYFLHHHGDALEL